MSSWEKKIFKNIIKDVGQEFQPDTILLIRIDNFLKEKVTLFWENKNISTWRNNSLDFDHIGFAFDQI